MAISTIGILRNKVSPFEIFSRVKLSIKELKDGQRTLGGIPLPASSTIDCRLDNGFLVFTFWDGEQRRTMYVFFNCDSDYASLAPCIIFSIGAYGLACETIKRVLKECQDLGETYFLDNDCSDKEPEIYRGD